MAGGAGQCSTSLRGCSTMRGRTSGWRRRPFWRSTARRRLTPRIPKPLAPRSGLALPRRAESAALGRSEWADHAPAPPPKGRHAQPWEAAAPASPAVGEKDAEQRQKRGSGIFLVNAQSLVLASDVIWCSHGLLDCESTETLIPRLGEKSK